MLLFVKMCSIKSNQLYFFKWERKTDRLHLYIHGTELILVKCTKFTALMSKTMVGEFRIPEVLEFKS